MRLQNELFDGIKKNMHTLPFVSPLHKLFHEDRATFWYVVKRWAWFEHREFASQVTSADLHEIEEYLAAFTEWQQSDRSVPFTAFHQKAQLTVQTT